MTSPAEQFHAALSEGNLSAAQETLHSLMDSSEVSEWGPLAIEHAKAAHAALGHRSEKALPDLKDLDRAVDACSATNYEDADTQQLLSDLHHAKAVILWCSKDNDGAFKEMTLALKHLNLATGKATPEMILKGALIRRDRGERPAYEMGRKIASQKFDRYDNPRMFPDTEAYLAKIEGYFKRNPLCGDEVDDLYSIMMRQPR